MKIAEFKCWQFVKLYFWTLLLEEHNSCGYEFNYVVTTKYDF